MKDKIKKVITFIGFIIVVFASIMMVLDGLIDLTTFLPSVFAVCFIFAENKTLKNFGYAISALNLAIGLMYFESESTMVLSIGLIIMSCASILYLIEIVFSFFGFVLGKKKGSSCKGDAQDDYTEIEKYAQLHSEGILNEEEYTSLKANILSIETNKKQTTLDDLKKWKKLLDQKLISEEEYSNIKKKILK